MNLILKIFTVAFVLLSSNLTFAQEHETSLNESHDTEEGPKHMISVELGHNHLSDGFVDGEKHWLTVPSWSVNYIYRLNHKFGIGLQTDMIVESFKVVSKDSKNNLDIERTFPISFVGIGGFKPVHFLFLFIGGGLEYAPEETFSLLRLGVEPGIEINEKWELIFSMVYDVKIDAYNNWNIGVGVARVF